MLTLFPCSLICRLCCVFLILVGAMWFNSHRLLLLVGQEEIIAAMAAKYLRILFPGLCCFMVTQCLQSPGGVVWDWFAAVASQSIVSFLQFPT